MGNISFKWGMFLLNGEYFFYMKKYKANNKRGNNKKSKTLFTFDIMVSKEIYYVIS